MTARIGRSKARLAAIIAGTAVAGAAVLAGASLASADPIVTPNNGTVTTHAPDFTPGPGDTVTLIGPTYPDHVPAQRISPAHPFLPGTGSSTGSSAGFDTGSSASA
ncbi:hypothetical protein [Nocardia sp. NPDC052566]|uniref:hypothetical protein n=1 Tax=Nocardia sp. NPDC052566 TaxID=3364330 RepID=UPI0037CB6873